MPWFVKKTDRTREEEHQHDAEHKSPVANAIGDKGFLRSVACFFAIDVVSDEKVRTETDSFPTHKHQQEVVSQHQRQHREHEKIQVSEETIEALVAMHVAHGKQVN